MLQRHDALAAGAMERRTRWARGARPAASWQSPLPACGPCDPDAVSSTIATPLLLSPLTLRSATSTVRADASRVNETALCCPIRSFRTRGLRGWSDRGCICDAYRGPERSRPSLCQGGGSALVRNSPRDGPSCTNGRAAGGGCRCPMHPMGHGRCTMRTCAAGPAYAGARQRRAAWCTGVEWRWRPSPDGVAAPLGPSRASLHPSPCSQSCAPCMHCIVAFSHPHSPHSSSADDTDAGSDTAPLTTSNDAEPDR